MYLGWFALLLVGLTVFTPVVRGNGYMIDPPARGSMWRVGYDTPKDYDDMDINCGGFFRQWYLNSGKCGVCGDPYDGERRHEAGGKFAPGIVTKYYRTGGTIPIRVNLTAPHSGWFEFRLCPNNDVKRAATRTCFENYLLRMADDKTRFTDIPAFNPTSIVVNYQLPPGLKCDQCVLQWLYNTGKDWRCDENAKCGLGLGIQEQFVGCADIGITIDGKPPRGSSNGDSTSTTPADTGTGTSASGNGGSTKGAGSNDSTTKGSNPDKSTTTRSNSGMDTTKGGNSGKVTTTESNSGGLTTKGSNFGGYTSAGSNSGKSTTTGSNAGGPTATGSNSGRLTTRGNIGGLTTTGSNSGGSSSTGSNSGRSTTRGNIGGLTTTGTNSGGSASEGSNSGRSTTSSNSGGLSTTESNSGRSTTERVTTSGNNIGGGSTTVVPLVLRGECRGKGVLEGWRDFDEECRESCYTLSNCLITFCNDKCILRAKQFDACRVTGVCPPN